MTIGINRGSLILDKQPKDDMTLPEIAGLNRDQVLTLMNSRSYKQYCDGIEAYLKGKCIFCDPLGPKNKVLFETDGGEHAWRVWENPFPLKRTSRHLIMAPVQHLTDPNLITRWDWIKQGEIWLYARDVLGIKGGACVGRFGSPEFNAGSILHLHTNIIVPDGTGDVQITVGKSPEKMELIARRVVVFEKLRTGTSRLEDLSPEELELVDGRI